MYNTLVVYSYVSDEKDDQYMLIPDPFTPIPISAGILTNIASNILVHHAQRLEGTRVGQMLKWTGLIEPNFDERLHNTLSKALSLYFKEHPQYELTGIEAFFRDPAVGQQIGNYILNGQLPDQNQIQQAINATAKYYSSNLVFHRWEFSLKYWSRQTPWLRKYRRVKSG